MASVKHNVCSTIKPKEVEYNDKYVYVNSDVRESNGSAGNMYTYTVTKYEKDEFIMALSNGQISLGERALAIEDALLEISEIIYK